MQNTPNPFTLSEPISIEHDGQTITGIVRWWSKDIEVEITAPYQRATGGLHMPFACPMTYHEEDRRKNSAAGILRSLYNQCKAARRRMKRVKETLQALDEKDAQPSEVNRLRAEIKELRRRFRHEGLPKREYDAALHPLNKKLREAEYREERQTRRFLRRRLPGGRRDITMLRQMVEDPASFGLPPASEPTAEEPAGDDTNP